ncbi:MAG: hypothetical protein QM779_10105 [Propionicimonas sp.]|uniref:hypothetical protein n=1 Tax=Propionicimonas sp. TaxID=1955623 RepID=UPI003D0FE2E2
MSVQRLLAASVAALTMAGSTVLTSPAAQAVPPAATPAATAAPDYDGDGTADLAVTDATADTEAWQITVYYGSGDTAEITTDDVDGAWSIGTYLLARDVNGDGYTDLVFSARLSGVGPAVEIVPGSAGGLDLAARRAFPLPDSQDARITSLGLVTAPVPRLAVGVQTDSLSTVRAYALDADGVPTGDPVVLRPGKGKLPKLSNPESFGSALTSWGKRLFVAAPYTNVGGVRDAGAVVAVTFSASGVSAAVVLSQATTGVPGAPGIGDAFGFSVAARDGYLIVGTPLDDVGTRQDTGSVQVFRLTSSKITPVTRLSQATTAVPGKAERNDQFGSSVELANVCAGVLSAVVGGSGEVIVASHERDGSAWVIPLAKAKGCVAQQLYQGHGLSGSPAGHSLGDFVSVLRDAASTTDELVIGGFGSAEDYQGRLVRWSPSAGETLGVNGLFAGAAGR